MRAGIAVAALLTAATAFAQNAQDELERQLKEMVGKPPTKLLIEFEGLDQPQYKLSEASFELDGSTLPAPSSEKLNGQGRHLIFHGDVKPGKHMLVAKVAITDVAGALFSYEAGYTFKMAKSIGFEQQPGLEVQIHLEGELNPSEKDKNKKWNVKANTQVKMLAKLEDGSMPDVPKPNIAKEVVDAGVVVAEVSPAEKAKILKDQQAEEARAKKQAAMEAAKQKKEDAAAAKAAAAEAKKAAAEEKRAAAKARKEAALAAKADAAAEAKRKKEEAAAAKAGKTPVANANPTPTEPVANPNPTPTPTEPVAEAPVDAGAPAVAVAEPPPAKPTPAPTPAPPAEPESGAGLPLPLPVLIGIAVALLGLIIFVATRKKSPPAQF